MRTNEFERSKVGLHHFALLSFAISTVAVLILSQTLCYNLHDRPYEENVVPAYLALNLDGHTSLHPFEHPAILPRMIARLDAWPVNSVFWSLMILRMSGCCIFILALGAICHSLWEEGKKYWSIHSVELIIFFCCIVCLPTIAMHLFRATPFPLVLLSIWAIIRFGLATPTPLSILLTALASFTAISTFVYGIILVVAAMLSLSIILVINTKYMQAVYIGSTVLVTTLLTVYLDYDVFRDLYHGLQDHYWAQRLPENVLYLWRPFYLLWARTIGYGWPFLSSVLSCFSFLLSLFCIARSRQQPRLAAFSLTYLLSYLLFFFVQAISGKPIFIAYSSTVFLFMGCIPAISLLAIPSVKFVTQCLLYCVALVTMFNSIDKLNDLSHWGSMHRPALFVDKLTDAEEDGSITMCGSRVFFTLVPFLSRDDFERVRIVSCNRITCDKFVSAGLLKDRTFLTFRDAVKNDDQVIGIVVSAEAQKLYAETGSAETLEEFYLPVPCYPVGLVSGRIYRLPESRARIETPP